MRQVHAFPLFPFRNLFPGLTLMQHELKGSQLPYLDSEKYEKKTKPTTVTLVYIHTVMIKFH